MGSRHICGTSLQKSLPPEKAVQPNARDGGHPAGLSKPPEATTNQGREYIKKIKPFLLPIIIAIASIALVLLRALKVTDWVSISIVFVGLVGVALSLTSAIKSKAIIIRLSEKVEGIGVEPTNNPEWAYVIVDAEEKILFGIRHDGTVDWGVGIPRPIREELEKMKDRINNS